MKFTAKLTRPEGIGTWTYISVPPESVAEYGKKGQVPVRGTIDGRPFRNVLMPTGRGTHYLVVNKEIRDVIGKEAGADVEAVIEFDPEPRGTEALDIPEALSAMLESSPEAKAKWDKMPPSHRKEYLSFIREAKKEETRTKRIGKVIEEMLSK